MNIMQNSLLNYGISIDLWFYGVMLLLGTEINEPFHELEVIDSLSSIIRWVIGIEDYRFTVSGTQ